MKILILGSKGMLGRDLVKVFSSYDLTAWDKDKLDVTDKAQVKEKITTIKPDIIINATGYTDVDGAENNQELAMAINGYAVEHLAKVSDQIGSILVYFSTEYVFDGKNKEGYDESANSSPINTYGKSKTLGEELLQENCNNFYLIRSSWLYGKNPQVGKPRGINFVELMIKLSQERDEIEVVNDQFGRPTYTIDLAESTKKLIESQKPFGVYHLVNESESRGVSWYEFAKKIFAIKDIKVNLKAISSDQYPLKALRPKHAVLLNTKFEKLRGWEEALTDYLSG